MVARVEGLFGVKGWVKLRSYTRPPDNLLRFRHFGIGEPGEHRGLDVAGLQRRGRGFAAGFEGYEDRDAALALVGCDLWVPRADLPPVRRGEMYWSDLIGFRVQGEDGPLGTVSGFIETAAHDVMVVDDAGVERLIPYVPKAIVRKVDPQGRRIDVRWRRDYED